MKITICKLLDKEYGIDISQLKEIIRLKEITPIPDAAKFVEGVISLRGKVIPIVNLRARLGFERKEFEKADRIVLVNVNGSLIGIVVDAVLDVISIDEANITTPDDVINAEEYFIGVAKLEDRLILLIDVDKLFSLEVKAGIKKVQERVQIKNKE